MARPTRVPATHDPAIDGVLGGTKWVGTVSYSFPDNRFSDYELYYPLPQAGFPLFSSNFTRAHPRQEEAVHHILKGFWAGSEVTNPMSAHVRTMAVEEFTNLKFRYAGRNEADIRIAQSSSLDRPGEAWRPGVNPFGIGEYDGDVWLRTTRVPDPQVGNFPYHVILHELGHAVGLKHGHQGGGPGRTAVPADRDSLEFTVMTYRSFEGGPTRYSNEAFGFPQSFMMLDIAALQEMYGANYNYNNGDTTYRWNSLTGEMTINNSPQGVPGGNPTRGNPNNIFLTIWDGGGRDTYNVSNYGNGVSIDLEPGRWSVLSPDQLARLGTDSMRNAHFARGNVFNALPDPDQAVQRNLIENAIGGAGDDTLKGNTADNHLDGRGGSDTLSGLDGSDTLDGGDGDDQLDGGDGNDQLNGDDGDDQLSGGNGDDVLLGGSDSDTLDGGDGNDQLEGGIGSSDTFRFVAGAGDDEIFDFEKGVDRIELRDFVTAEGFFLLFEHLDTNPSGPNGVLDDADEHVSIDSAGNTTIDFYLFGGGQLTVRGLGSSLLTVSDFV